MRFSAPLVAALLLLPAASSAEAPPAPAPWKTVAASGPVEALPASRGDEAWTRVSRGDRFAPLDRVRTGKRGRATLAEGATLLLLDPESDVTLPERAPGQPTAVVQRRGNVVYEVDGKTHRGFRVETPYLVAGVKGTVFLVSVADGRAAVTVEEGVVSVETRDGRTLDVTAGETLLVDGAEAAEVRLLRADGRGDGSREGRKEAKREAGKLDRIVAESDALVATAERSDDLRKETENAVKDPVRDPVESVEETKDETRKTVEDTVHEVEKTAERVTEDARNTGTVPPPSN